MRIENLVLNMEVFINREVAGSEYTYNSDRIQETLWDPQQQVSFQRVFLRKAQNDYRYSYITNNADPNNSIVCIKY